MFPPTFAPDRKIPTRIVWLAVGVGVHTGMRPSGAGIVGRGKFSRVPADIPVLLSRRSTLALRRPPREMISNRTKVALAAARKRGVVLGGRRGAHRIEHHGVEGREASLETRRLRARHRAGEIQEVIVHIRSEGVSSLQGIARVLNERSIRAPRGGRWSAGQIARVLSSRAEYPPRS